MRRILLAFIAIGIAFIISAFIYQNGFRDQPADAVYPPVLNLAEGASRSVLDEKSTTTQFFISADSGYLYKSAQDEEAAAMDFISKNPEVINSNVQGSSTLSTSAVKKKLFPKSIAKNIVLIRKRKDADGSKHLYFSQKIGNSPVFGSALSVHIRNKGEIYAVVGSLVSEESVPASVLSVNQAEQIALSKASEKTASTSSLMVVSSAKGVFNTALVNGGETSSNVPVQEITVADNPELPKSGEKLFVSLLDGTIVYREPIMHNALQRKIFDCDGGLSTCPLVRTEGQAPTNRQQPDLLYTFLGDTYSFFQNTFGRDSYDNIGAELVGFTNVTDAEVGCPNAAWLPSPFNRLLICPGMVSNDVVAHEFTHAVVESTADLMIYKQSGALNEAVADIFSFGVDSDWAIGEDTNYGILRDARNPPADPVRGGGAHPDRIFSSLYRCTEADQGGVHANMTIITKTFYLMSEGGSFNGCTIAPIGKSAAHKIWYRALTTYMSVNSNFGYAYLAVAQACTDLYGATSQACAQTVKSFQATEIDQQPTNTQEGARCLNIAPRKPLCANIPTLTNVPTVTFAPTITTAPTSGSCPMKPTGDADCNNVIDLIDFEIWRKEMTRAVSSLDGDFNKDGKSDIVDFEIWRKGRFGL